MALSEKKTISKANYLTINFMYKKTKQKAKRKLITSNVS